MMKDEEQRVDIFDNKLSSRSLLRHLFYFLVSVLLLRHKETKFREQNRDDSLEHYYSVLNCPNLACIDHPWRVFEFSSGITPFYSRILFIFSRICQLWSPVETVTAETRFSFCIEYFGSLFCPHLFSLCGRLLFDSARTGRGEHPPLLQIAFSILLRY